MTHTNYWTDAERERLRKLVETGLSNAAIAERLGRSKERVSRELGKLRRAELTTRQQRRKG